MTYSRDEFWDVRLREEHDLRLLEDRRDRVSRAVELGKRALHLRGQPGYDDFVKAVESCKQGVIQQMLRDDVSDSNLRFLQGQAKALKDVLFILQRLDQNVAALEADLGVVQNEILELKKQMPANRREASDVEP